MIRTITMSPNLILSKPCQKVKHFDGLLISLTKDLIQTMLDQNGVGIAANQCNISKKICVIRDLSNKANHLVMINPKIISYEGIQKVDDEACLSIFDTICEVSRATTLEVKWQDEFGHVRRGKFQMPYSRIIMHEVDHLNGLLITDIAINIIDLKNKYLNQVALNEIKSINLEESLTEGTVNFG